MFFFFDSLLPVLHFYLNLSQMNYRLMRKECGQLAIEMNICEINSTKSPSSSSFAESNLNVHIKTQGGVTNCDIS